MQMEDGPFIGRWHERAQLDRALDQLRAGCHGIVEVTGEPGIGKTRLLAELAARGRGAGHLVLAGRAAEFERTTMLGVVVDALDDWLARLDPAARLALAGDLMPSLAGVLPALGPPVSGSTPVAGARHGLYRDVRLLLDRIGAAQGLVLVLDDVHWADGSTVELLGHLVRRPLRAPVLLALAYRPRQASAQLLSAVVPAGDAGTVRIELGALTRGEADELLGVLGTDPSGAIPQPRSARPDETLDAPEPPSGYVRKLLYQQSGGNPFYLRALAQAARDVRDDAPAGIVPVGIREVPASVRRILMAEFAALSPDGARVASAAAVAGDTFDPELVAVIAGTDDEAALCGIDELSARDLVREAGGGRRFRYRHPLLRHVAYQAASAGWRLAAHARAAEALSRRGAPLIVRAHHIERSTRPGDEASVQALLAAAREVGSQAPAIAAHWLSIALRSLPDRDDVQPQRISLLLELAQALGLAGNLNASRRIAHQVLRLLPEQPAAPRMRAVTFCAMVERLLGRHAEALALLAGEMTRVGGDPPEAAALALELAVASLMRGDIASNHAWAAQALARARRHGDRPVQSAALGFLAMAQYAQGDVPRALRHLDEAVTLVDAMTDAELAGRLDAALWLGWNEIYLERYQDAVRHLERGLVLTRATGQAYLLPLMLACLATALRWLGRLPDAAGYAEEAVDAADLSGSDELRCIALAVRSWIASWTGDRQLALDAGRAAVAAAATRNSWFASVATAMLGRMEVIARESGSVDEILARFGGDDLPTIDPRTRISWWEVLVRAELADGRPDRAADFVERADASARRLGLAGHIGLAKLARAQLLAATGQRSSAAKLAIRAAAHFAVVGCRLDAGRAHLLAGMTSAEPGLALDHLQRAHLLLAECGCHELSRQALRERRRASLVPRQRDGEDALTAREHEIAGLVTEGLTNRQIARRLGITAKTVEKHLGRIFAKLGVRSRASVARLVARGYGTLAPAIHATPPPFRATTSPPAPS
jgi:DNA-binding CsgD family transcriptional regulator